MKKNIITYLLLNLYFLNCFTQNVTTFDDCSESISETEELSDETESKSSEIFEILEDLIDHPINLNTADTKEFEQLFFLSPSQINKIIEYRIKNKEFKSIYELPSVEGVDIVTAQKMSPFVTVKSIDYFDTVHFKYIHKGSRNKVLMLSVSNIEQKAGYNSKYDSLDKGFIGSPLKILAKYRYSNHEKIEMGLTVEKDAGEKLIYRNKPEFYSGFILLNKFKKLNKLILGDYNANYGEGLVMWNGFAIGKTSLIGSVTKVNQGIQQYTSTSESNYLRGFALNSLMGKVSVTLFVSYKPIDAALNKDTIENVSYFSSFKTSGIHNTINELNSKESVKELLAGYNISSQINNLVIGNTCIAMYFSESFKKREEPYNYFAYSGQKLLANSFNFRYNFRAFFLSGEQAFSNNGGIASTANLNYELASNLGISILTRFFNKNYYVRYNNAFAENTFANNELGIYAGLDFSPFKNINIKAYSDFFNFPWLKYRVNSPSSGHEYQLQTEIKLSDAYKIYFRFKSKTKDLNISNESKIYQINKVQTNRYRLGFNYTISKELQMRNIVEFSKYVTSFGAKHGFLIGQDLSIRLPFRNSKFDFRYSIFDTEDYYTAIYVYENNIANTFSFPALSGKGFRTYCIVKANIYKGVDFGVRYSLTQFSDRNSISDGIYEIKGNRQSDITFRLTANF